MRALVLAAMVMMAMAPARASAQEQDTRIREIEAELGPLEAPVERWWWSWLAIHLALAAGQATWAAVTDDHGTRVDRLTGMTSALLGAGMLLVFVPPEMSAPDDLAEHAGASTLERRRHAEDVFADVVRAEHRAHSLLNHLLLFGWAIASGTFLWLGYDRPVSGALQAGSVVLIGELRILTRPTGAID